MLRKSANRKKYLLIPSVPTPNGRLHLGHIGGPYLSADIFARHAESAGHHASIIAGTDSYESYVTAKAVKAGKTPEQICHYYHDLIQQDLTAFHIKIDAMINPLSAEWQQQYHDWHVHILQKLQEQKAITIVPEKVWWHSQQRKFATGCWLQGYCPACQSTIAGYFCENCGAHFKPEEVKHSFRNSNLWLEKETSNLFMQIPSYTDLTQFGINTTIAGIYQKFLQQQNQLLRLTANTDWGLKLPSFYALPQSRLFNYGFMFAYFLMMGEIAGQLDGSNKNAFATDSDVVTLATFGFDNAVPFLASILGISHHCKTVKPFDYYLVNYFYYLDASKFSTSRDHAIWASDIAQQSEHSADITRLFLALIDVQQQIGNFDSAKFMNFQREMSDWIAHKVIQPLASRTNSLPITVNSSVIEHLENFWLQQQQMLQPQHFSPHRAAQRVIDWQQQIQQIDSQNPDYLWWLKGFALLSYPFMPRLAEKVWNALGCNGKPTVKHFI